MRRAAQGYRTALPLFVDLAFGAETLFRSQAGRHPPPCDWRARDARLRVPMSSRPKPLGVVDPVLLGNDQRPVCSARRDLGVQRSLAPVRNAIRKNLAIVRLDRVLIPNVRPPASSSRTVDVGASESAIVRTTQAFQAAQGAAGFCRMLPRRAATTRRTHWPGLALLQPSHLTDEPRGARVSAPTEIRHGILLSSFWRSPDSPK
jgi:hypothetical protein